MNTDPTPPGPTPLPGLELLPGADVVSGPGRRGRPRTTGRHTCDRCGRSTGRIVARWPDGRICGICYRIATETYGDCADCGRHRLLPGRDGERQLCRACAGITAPLDCTRCGREGARYRRGICARCALRDDLTVLLMPDSGGGRAPELARLVDVLTGVDRPESIHVWKRNPKVTALLTGLGNGTVSLDHAGLDTTSAGQAREHLRQLLVHHGLLPARDPDLGLFQHWLADRLASIDQVEVRQPLERFATWHHLRRIRALVAAGKPARAAVHYAKQEITVTGQFLTWLAVERGTSIGECRQDDIETWLAGGPSTRYSMRTFIIWAGRTRLCPKELTVAHRTARSSPLLGQQQRLDWLAACLTGNTETLAYRTAGVLLLLYAQPLTRIVELPTTAVHVSPQEIRLQLGKHPVPLPEPFADLLRCHLQHRPNMRTGNTTDNPWLFPSTRAGRHLHPNTVMIRLRELGIELLAARNSALRNLVTQVPAPLVAKALGYSHPVTARHAAEAAAPMSQYAAIKTHPR